MAAGCDQWRKSYRRHPFTVPPGVEALDIAFSYDRGQEFPHSLLTLSLFDPRGFRGAGHRYAPRQAVRDRAKSSP